jgi:hypothetical protein
MNRWVWFCTCALLGVVMLICGLLVPAHLRAVDVRLLQQAGGSSPALTEQGLALLDEKNLGAAQLIFLAAQTQDLPGRERLGLALTNQVRQHPAWLVWGGGEYHLDVLFKPAREGVASAGFPEPLTEWAVRSENRATVLELLRVSRRPAVQELLRFRSATNTAIFPPSQSASGQALDAAISVCGLLLEEGRLSPGLSSAVLAAASAANRGAASQPVEQILLDMMSLGQRFNWGQLAEFLGRVNDAETLRLQANLVRQADARLPLLFSAVELSGRPAAVAKYLTTFSQTGLNDLGASLRFGAGGLNELLQRNQRVYSSGARLQLVPGLCWQAPGCALTLKWSLYLLAGFVFAAAFHFGRPAVSALERPLQVRGFHIAREFLFALGFLLVVLLLSEPFLAQESQKADFSFRLRLPMVVSAAPVQAVSANSSIMKQQSLSLLTLLLFFVLQGLLYTASLVKLAEIRRQRVPARLKLKLLDNEDHLFDAGLYLGFVGTIISLILVSLQVFKFSLMAAYSSTSFGIIFVVIFKIFNLRPMRRKLVLEADAAGPEPAAPAAQPTLATPS